MRIHNLYTDASGQSHFRDIEVEWVEESRAGKLSRRLPATGIIFREVQPDYDLDWHPAPRRQYIINLDAGVQITASDGEARARGFDAVSTLTAMDIEGIDVAVMYGTRGRQILCHDDLKPDYAAALARAYNDWAADYCKADPQRLKFAAQIAMQDVPSAVEETRRAVKELGAVAVIGTPNPVNGQHLHDEACEPLWDALGELDVPVGFHP